jgi:hypothetical protein
MMNGYTHTDIYIRICIAELEKIHTLTTEHITYCAYSLKQYDIFVYMIYKIVFVLWHICVCAHVRVYIGSAYEM